MTTKHHENVKYYEEIGGIGRYYIMQFFESWLGCNVEGLGGKHQSAGLCHQHTSTLNNENSLLIIIDTAEPTGNT